MVGLGRPRQAQANLGRNMTTNAQPSLVDLLERDLLARNGSPLIGGHDLRAALGYSSLDALRKASLKGRLPVPVFDVPHRKGKFALVKDVAVWLAHLRQSSTAGVGREGPG